jgi:hypothetical protein
MENRKVRAPDVSTRSIGEPQRRLRENIPVGTEIQTDARRSAMFWRVWSPHSLPRLLTTRKSMSMACSYRAAGKLLDASKPSYNEGKTKTAERLTRSSSLQSARG